MPATALLASEVRERQSTGLSRPTRVAIAFAALALGLTLVLPLWHIGLKAPQYPEGLGLYIAIDRIEGQRPQDLNSINNLNHYIGMKRITPEDIPELRYMSWLVVGLMGTGLLVAGLGRRGSLWAWTAVFALSAAAGLADFYRWGYDYGHDLADDAIIKVPGMTYQPPLLGSKQLLNFSATSWPASGGWILIVALGVAFSFSVSEWRRSRAQL